MLLFLVVFLSCFWYKGNANYLILQDFFKEICKKFVKTAF